MSAAVNRTCQSCAVSNSEKHQHQKRFQASRDDLNYVPRKLKATFLCGICHRVHEFDFAEARVCERAANCCGRYGECQNCHLAVRPAAA
jgi:uncharacterized protein YcgL (UPF0745 family)